MKRLGNASLSSKRSRIRLWTGTCYTMLLKGHSMTLRRSYEDRFGGMSEAVIPVGFTRIIPAKAEVSAFYMIADETGRAECPLLGWWEYES